MKKILLIFFLLAISSTLFSYQWPSNKESLGKLFGDTSAKNVQDGILFTGENQAVYPLADGDVIFYQDSFQFGDLDYSGEEGNILILSHKGDFRSYYRNFIPTEGFNNSSTILQSEMVGVSGRDNGDFIFSIFDEKKDEYINPQQLLPLLADNLSPVISGVFLYKDGAYMKVLKNKRVPAGSSQLYIDTYDVVKLNNKFKKFNPFSIYIFIDGFERFHVSFSSIKEIDGKLYFSGSDNVPVDNFLRNSSFLFGGDVYLTRGRSLIEVVVRDNNGNEASRSFSVIVE